jgi:hypothetical protein
MLDEFLQNFRRGLVLGRSRIGDRVEPLEGFGRPFVLEIAFVAVNLRCGSYKVSATGEFLGDTVEACTFPNWIGDVRTQKEIIAKIEGSRLSEEFHQPAGAVIRLVWQRVD